MSETQRGNIKAPVAVDQRGPLKIDAPIAAFDQSFEDYWSIKDPFCDAIEKLPIHRRKHNLALACIENSIDNLGCIP
ncbi:hypothetical protein J2W42_000654 [Rhizobium tibeticum]|uniref:Uncharacterized protein n=2 Tax=Rhizobium tibeticum TaxID=501024 RepID=A0A1H8TX30_9HYPH|nr:hypothetical protein [Rhizobium tibeticum]SEI15681.1 hypothetical protein RTCCBAU85039_5294 [Rhizobium tibeticum]SEO94978.1 hypothetical protein SAMN05216228_103078 [Rhizobium tibeticum]